MDTDALYRDVQAFRRALEECRGSLDPTTFGRFPHGCCGAASEILAAYLENRGYGAFVYVEGIESHDNFPPWSHAWLEHDGLIVDITQDQFEDRSEPVFVAADRTWHDSRFPEQTRHERFEERPLDFSKTYARIQREIDRQGGTS